MMKQLATMSYTLNAYPKLSSGLLDGGRAATLKPKP
jgi:hypothetical protein